MAQMFNVKNRSASVTGYTIPDLGVRRSFAPGETKRISLEELEKLSYIPGGMALLANFLQIEESANLMRNVQPEYYMSEKDVEKLIKEGSLDEFLDCLDFAPEGVIELIKVIAAKLPLNDVQKREALKNKTGYDLDRALLNMRLVKEEETAEGKVEETTLERRVKKTDTGRRVTPNYKVVTPKGE